VIKSISKRKTVQYKSPHFTHTNIVKIRNKEYLYMKATGIVRRIDDLGRVVIPKEIRRTMRIRECDPIGTCCYIPHKAKQHMGFSDLCAVFCIK